MSNAAAPGLRLAIEHLRLEGTGPLLADRLAGRIEAHLGRLIDAWGVPEALAGRGALHLDGARVEVERGMGQEEIAAAIARQLFERWYGPLPPWAGPPAPAGDEVAGTDEEEDEG